MLLYTLFVCQPPELFDPGPFFGRFFFLFLFALFLVFFSPLMSELLKIFPLGDHGVGKTSLITRFVGNRFVDEYDPGLNDSWRKVMEVEGKTVVVEIIDTYDTCVEFEALSQTLVLDSDIFLVLYSIRRFETFKSVPKNLEFVYRVQERGDLPIIVVGLMSDLEIEREVSKDEGEEYVGLHEGVLFMEASAKTGENVVEVFQMAVKRYEELEMERNGVEEGGKGRGRRKRNENVPPQPIVHDIIRGRTVKPAKR